MLSKGRFLLGPHGLKAWQCRGGPTVSVQSGRDEQRPPGCSTLCSLMGKYLTLGCVGGRGWMFEISIIIMLSLGVCVGGVSMGGGGY